MLITIIDEDIDVLLDHFKIRNILVDELLYNHLIKISNRLCQQKGLENKLVKLLEVLQK